MRSPGWLAAWLAGALMAAPATVRAEGCTLNLFAELPVTMEGPRASVPVRINGHPTSFWLDSGAFFSIMSRAKAAELDLTVNPISGADLRIMGIGGSAVAEVTKVQSFGFAKADLKNVDFLVGGSDVGNALIGVNILAFRDTEFDLAHGSVKLADARGCHKMNLAYWAQGKQAFVVPLNPDPPGVLHYFRIPVTINGVKIDAELDTGAPLSLLSRKAAERAGLDLKGPSAVAINGIGGFGRHRLGGWSVSVGDIGIGDEHVLKSRVDVIDGSISDGSNAPDMLLGADFALAHHIYVSRREHLVFFTYAGGRPFISSAPEPVQAKAVAAAGSAPATDAIPGGMHRVAAVSETTPEPTTADAFARRASVHVTEQAYAAAIDDYTAAIRLAPSEAGYYRDRAEAYERNGQPLLARADLDKAIALDPHQGALLTLRARLKLRERDRAGALIDLEAAVKEMSPSSLETAQIAQSFVAAGKPERAIGLLGPVIAAHGDDSQLGSLLNARCWARALANVDLSAAADDCNRAIRRAGPIPAFLDSRALVLYRRGDLAAAVADYDAALKDTQRRSAWSLFMRGAARAKLGDAAGAKADQDAAKAIRPDIAEETSRYGLP